MSTLAIASGLSNGNPRHDGTSNWCEATPSDTFWAAATDAATASQFPAPLIALVGPVSSKRISSGSRPSPQAGRAQAAFSTRAHAAQPQQQARLLQGDVDEVIEQMSST